MTKPRSRKLKVFQAQFGFYDTVVAAPSRAAALRAWGIRRNVFADGHAKEATERAAIAAAIENPETVLKRPVGSTGPFEINPTALPEVPDAPSKMTETFRRKTEQPRRPPANRSKLDAAEAALRELDARRKAEEAELRRDQEALEAKRAAAHDEYVKARKAATAAVVDARTAYRKAGGTD